MSGSSTERSSHQAAAAAAAAAVEQLSDAIIRSIQSGGAELPTVVINGTSGAGNAEVQWTEYAATARATDAVVAELHGSAASIQKRFEGSVPDFDLSIAFDTNGRPLLYGACLGLALADRNLHHSHPNSNSHSSSSDKPASSSPLQVFMAVLRYLHSELECPPDQPTFRPGGCHRPPIHLLARACYPRAVKALLQCGADPADTDDEGWTALMATCMAADGDDRNAPTMEERCQTARLLLDASEQTAADDVPPLVNRHNYRGYTALHLACEARMGPMVQLLLRRGADPLLRTWVGESPLGLVAWNEGDSDDDDCSGEICCNYLKSATAKCSAEERRFFDQERRAVDLIKLVDRTLIPLANSESIDAARRDSLLLAAIMKTVGMDPEALLDHPIAENWYETLHQRVSDLFPEAYVTIYRNGAPTEEEYDLITAHDGHAKDEGEFMIPADKDRPEEGGARRLDVGLMRREAMVPYRQRGFCPRNMDNIVKCLVNPIKHSIAFAVPSDSVLDRIAAAAPRIVECGAGTGYWSSVLRLHGADVAAYDANPPTIRRDGPDASSIDAKNAFFSSDAAFTEVKKGDGTSIFDGEEGKSLAMDRALLLVWPNNADHIDNPHIYDASSSNSSSQPVWDADCLTAYMDAGGQTVIYVGEREEQIELDDEATAPDCGFCSSRRFQQMLKDEFVLEEHLACPCWCLKEDDVTIWRRK